MELDPWDSPPSYSKEGCTDCHYHSCSQARSSELLVQAQIYRQGEAEAIHSRAHSTLWEIHFWLGTWECRLWKSYSWPPCDIS